MKAGIIGCGNISDIYLQNCSVFANLEAVACSDLIMDRARAKAGKYGIAACTVDEMLHDPGIELIFNLTVPKVHAEVSLAALEAGKNVYSEKPLAVAREDGRRILALAQAKGLRVGCAPDTFLGGGLQTCRKIIDDGAIGVPLGAVAFMAGRGPEGWHPDPEFFYKPGGGPMFDMGPYYLTALVTLLGPIHRVTGSARISIPERVIGSQPHFGEKIKVETPTHLAGVLDFTGGAVGTILTSFDVWAAHLPRIEIYGTEGSLSVPDPNTFKGPVHLWRGGSKEWMDIPLTHGYAENSRGLGAADMARAIETSRPHRASGDLAFHVLDIMHAIHDASREGQHIELASSIERPASLSSGLKHGWVE